MGRARGSGGTPSKIAEKGKRKQRDDEGEVQSKKKKVDSSNKVLKFDFCMNVKRYDEFMCHYDGKKVLKGRVFDFYGLGSYPGNLEMEVTDWLEFQGWKEIFSYQAPTYPRLVQILMCNYNQTSRQSWIGKFKFDLSPAGLRNTLGLGALAVEEEEFTWPEKDELFRQLARKELDKPYVYLPARFLTLDQKLAHNVIFHMIYPKVGSSDQVPEKDARLIWALEKRKKLDLAKLMSDHLDFMKCNIGKVSLPYGMYWTKFFEKAGMDLTVESGDYFKNSEIINFTTIKRMGFKRVAGEWTLAKGPQEAEVPAPVPAPPAQAARRVESADREIEEEEERREEEVEEEAERADERDSLLESVMRSVEHHLPQPEEAAPSASTAAPATRSTRAHPNLYTSPPPTTRPRTTREPTSTQFTSQQMKSLKAFITSSLTKLESTFTHRLDTLNQRVDNIEFKIDTVISLVESTQPPTRPDPFKEKMKGVVIRDQPQSSSSESYHPLAKSPARPFPQPIPGPSTQPPSPKHPSPAPSPPPAQPSPQPTKQPSPIPSPQLSSRPPSPQTQAALTLAAMPFEEVATSPIATPKPIPTPSSSATISDIPSPQPSKASPKPASPNSPQTSPQPIPSQISQESSTSSKPQPQPIPEPEPTIQSPSFDPMLAMVLYKPPPEPTQAHTSTSSSQTLSDQLHSNVLINLDSDSSDSPDIPIYQPLSTQQPSAPAPIPSRPIITIDFAEFQRRTVENKKVMDRNIQYLAKGQSRRDPYPYPELTDPHCHQYLRIISSASSPTPLNVPTPVPTTDTAPAKPTSSTSFTLQRDTPVLSPYPISYIRRLPKALHPTPPTQPKPEPDAT